MKILFALALVGLTSTTAHASSFNIDCSNADGSVRTASGHMDNFIQITERDWNTGTDTPIRDDSGEVFLLNSVKNTDIKEEVNNGRCNGGTQGYLRRQTYASEVIITKADGTLFSKNTLNVAPDYQSVKTILVCESVITSIMPCKK